VLEASEGNSGNIGTVPIARYGVPVGEIMARLMTIHYLSLNPELPVGGPARLPAVINNTRS
jgi:hypothetical protein